LTTPARRPAAAARAGEQDLRAEQQRRRARVLDSVTLALAVVLATLLWLGREQLFAPDERTVAATPPTLGKGADFASFEPQPE
jgi:type VI protein secretion system component VasF